MREAGDQRGAVEMLELVELGAIDEARHDVADVVLAARVARHAEARQDHLILSPPLLQEGADGGRAGLECRIGAMAPGAGRGEMPPL